MWGLRYSLASPPGAPQQQLPPSLKPLCGLGWPEPCSLDPWPLGGSRSPHPGPLLPQAAATLTAGPLQARPAGFPAGSLVQLPRGGPGCSTLYGSLTSPRSASPQKRREPTGGGTPGRHLFCWSPVMAASEPPGAWGGH